MPDVQITIGGRTFEVSCQAGEEKFLHSAAQVLDREASALVSQIGRLPEARMLLMAGLMLADRAVGLEEKLQASEEMLGQKETELLELKSAPKPVPEKVEVPVIPQVVTDTMAELAARAEALADAVEDRAKAS